MNKFEYGIFKNSNEKGLIHADDGILASVSGGLDSTSLLLLLATFREKIHLDLQMIHFHHGLRKESDEEEQFVRALAEQVDAPIVVFRNSDLSGRKGIQNKAREWRNRILAEQRKKLGLTKIALGHHLNDLVETQLWKIIRGCSLFGLNPMREQEGALIRPLLGVPKESLERYLVGKGQSWKEDRSNQSADYTRNFIRNNIVPVIRECSGGRFNDKMLGLARDAALLETQFQQAVPAGKSLNYRDLRGLPPLYAREAIHRFLLKAGQKEINRANVEKIFNLVAENKENWSLNLKNGRTIRGANKILKID